MSLADILSGVAMPPATSGPITIDLPAVDLALPLYDFQQDAVEHIRTHKNVYIAYEMGLGKTPIGIATASMCHAVGIRTLIVVPASLRTTWEREFGKFAPHLNVAVLKGTTPHDIPDCDVLVIGDSVVKHWATPLSGHYNALIVDESHYYKNKDAKRTKALIAMSHGVTGPVVLMSGTPVPNGRHQELAPQFSIIGDSAWDAIGGKGRFWSYFCPADTSNSWGGRVNANSEELNALMNSTFMLRRRRADVIELPNKGRTPVSIEASRKHGNDYVRIQDDFINWLRDEGREMYGSQRAEALVQMNLLRKKAGEAKAEGIAQYVKDILNNHTTGVFIVAEHKDVMDNLLIKLHAYNPVSVRGGMTDDSKQEAIDAFCSGSSRVLVGQIIAAGTGLTLHGNGLNHRVVVAQLPWNPAQLVQAEDRLHRIGQTNDVEVEIALCHIDGQWTIDERLWMMLEKKAFATGEVIDGQGELLMADSIAEGVLDTFR